MSPAANNFKFTADYSKVISGMDDLKRSIAATNLQLAEMATKSGRAGKKGTEAASSIKGMAGKATKELTNMAAGFVGVSGAIGIATKALQFMREERTKGLQVLRQDVDTLKEFAQVATDDISVKALSKLQTDLALKGIPREQAGKIIFQAQSIGGLGVDPRLAGDISKFLPTEQIPELLSAAFTVQQNVPQFTREQIVNMLGRAGGESKLTLGQFGAPIARAIPLARLAQGQQFDLATNIAAVSATVGPQVSPEEAITAFKAFNTALSKSSLKGRGLLDQIESLGALSEADRKKIISEQRALIFFEIAKQENIKEEIRRLSPIVRAEVQKTGGPESFIAQRQRRVAATPALVSGIEDIVSIEKEKASNLAAFGVREAGIQTFIRGELSESRDRGESGFRRFLQSFSLQNQAFFGADPRKFRGIGPGGEILRRIRDKPIPGQPGGAQSEVGPPGLAGPPGMFNAGPVDVESAVSETQRRLRLGIPLEKSPQQRANIQANEAVFGGSIRSQMLRDKDLRRRVNLAASGFSQRFRGARMAGRGVDDRERFGDFKDFRALHAGVNPEFDPEFLESTRSQFLQGTGAEGDIVPITFYSRPGETSAHPGDVDRFSANPALQLLQQQTDLMEENKANRSNDLLRGM